MTKSSKEWMRRHVTDAYVRQAKKQGYRSRAAFKLLEIDRKERILGKGKAILDLGAAPGGWSQVAAEKGANVVAIDLLPVQPIPGVRVLQKDFREHAFEDPFDVVLCDVSPNLSGIRSADQARALELSVAAIGVCRKVLRENGVLLIKAFHGEAFDDLLLELKEAFREVKVIKPAASRDESRETYLLAKRLSPAA